jgi:hypothetical protein
MGGDDRVEETMKMKTRLDTSKEDRASRPFGEFVLRLKTSDPLVQTFIDHAADNSLPRLASWSEVRSHLNRVGADQNTLVGARLAWREYASAASGKQQKTHSTG